MVKTILRLEGLGIFLTSLYFYSLLSQNLWVFIILFLVPDVSMLGYLKDKSLGTRTYNLVHNYLTSSVLIIVGLVLNSNLLTSLGLILTGHVGLDRLIGFGLKYPTAFKDTHIQRL